MDPVIPTPTPSRQQGIIQRLKHNEPLLKVVDALLGLIIFGSIIVFIFSMTFQGDPSYLWYIPLAATVGYILSLTLVPRNDAQTLLKTLGTRLGIVSALILLGALFGAVIAIQNNGAPSLTSEDIQVLLTTWGLLISISATAVILLFITIWRSHQPTSLLYRIGRLTRIAGQMATGALIAFASFISFFVTNLIIDPPDE